MYESQVSNMGKFASIRVIGTLIIMVWLLPFSLLQQTYAADMGDDIKKTNHEIGRKIYNFRCYYCHGYSGDAATLATTFLDPKPMDFTKADQDELTLERIISAITDGREGTGMVSFTSVLNPEEIQILAEFVREEFVIKKAVNTLYHIEENGWGNHDRYKEAFPFAKGTIPIDTPDSELSLEQKRGKALFLSTCVSCHDRAVVRDEGVIWETQAVSYPRNQYSHRGEPLDAVSRATPFSKHDIPPKAEGLNAQERKGEGLFQKNCAFCHGADGTGKNWIGTFMEPHPRDLTNPEFMQGVDAEYLLSVIQEGLPGTSMPAWKSVLSESDIKAIIGYISKVFHPLK
ncbi:MAG: c-type cytochrome [Magnetococcales bacterium]|nr:c-type cytochrome [Magnetococcales bacterium]